MHTEVIKAVSLKRLARLQRLMKTDGLFTLILFENDFAAHKLSLTQHFNMLLISLGDIYVIADTALYYEAQRESPQNAILVENFTSDGIAKKILSMLSKDRSKIKLGVNKSWGRNKTSFLYEDLLDVLQRKGVEIVDATHILQRSSTNPIKMSL